MCAQYSKSKPVITICLYACLYFSALRQLRGSDDVSKELEEMFREKQDNEGEDHMSMWQVFTAKHLRLPLIISVVMHLSQQFSGINCVGVCYISITIIIMFKFIWNSSC